MKNKPPVIWINATLFTLTFIAAITLVPLYGIFIGFNAAEWLCFALLMFISGLSITAGYHRLWAHKTYQASSPVKIIYALGGALALQNSALHWSSDHRQHHKYVDINEKDPYSAKMGFWYSHIGWMLREYHSQGYHDYKNVRDLQNDKIVMWQHKHYLSLVLILNILLPLFLGFLSGNTLGMFLLAAVARLVVVHHCTFFINSLAHIWGKQPYTNKNTARDNGVLAFLTYGEGYHNFHHIFENDYRNGVKWWHYDPTKWLISALSRCGQTWDLKRVAEERIETARLKMQLINASHKISHLPNKEELLLKLQYEYEHVKNHIVHYYQAHKALLEAKSKRLCHQELSNQVKILKENLSNQLKHWRVLTNNSYKT